MHTVLIYHAHTHTHTKNILNTAWASAAVAHAVLTHTYQHSQLLRNVRLIHRRQNDFYLCVSAVIATETWLGGCLSQPVLYQND